VKHAIVPPPPSAQAAYSAAKRDEHGVLKFRPADLYNMGIFFFFWPDKSLKRTSSGSSACNRVMRPAVRRSGRCH